MNKIYRVIKNKLTNISVAVSEYTKTSSKGSRAFLAGSVLLVGGAVVPSALATISSPYETCEGTQCVIATYSPGENKADTLDLSSNDNEKGSISISNDTATIDLSLGSGYGAIASGTTVSSVEVSSGESITQLYTDFYVTASALTTELAAATDAYLQAQQATSNAETARDAAADAVTQATTNYDATEVGSTERILAQQALDSAVLAYNAAQDNYQSAQTNEGNAQTSQIAASTALTDYQTLLTLRDDQLVVTGDTSILQQSSTSSSIAITTEYVNYVDPITGAVFRIAKSTYRQTTSGLTDISPVLKIYQDIDESNQYLDMRIATVSGSDASLTVTGSGNAANDNLNVHAKDSSVYAVQSGASLTYNANTEYHLGNDSDESALYQVADKTISGSVSLYTVEYTGQVINSAWGTTYTINSVSDINQYSQDLVTYIQTNSDIRLTYSSADAMQAYYDTQMAILYSAIEAKGSTVEYEYTFSQSEIDAVFNKVAAGDIGLASTSNNNFILASGSGTTININGTINSTDSKGTIIKVEDDGETGRIINVTGGVISGGNATAIDASQTDLNVAASGVVTGGVKIDVGNIENYGQMSGFVTLNDGKIANFAGAQMHNISGESMVLENSGDIFGYVKASADSTVTNIASASITGNIMLTQSELENEAGAIITIVGDVLVTDDSSFLNSGTIITSDNSSTLISVDHSSFYNAEDADIYIGYQSADNVATFPTAADHQDGYIGIAVSNTNGYDVINAGNIYLSSTQSNVDLVSVTNGGKFTLLDSATIILGQEDNDILDELGTSGNSNTAILVSGSTSSVAVDGTIRLYDLGSTGVEVQDGGLATVSGNIYLNGQDSVPSALSDSNGVRNFGVWVEGNGSELILSDDSLIALNSDSAVGVHVRDGGTVEITDQSSITFSADHSDQIGFLISGNTGPSNLYVNYTTSESIELQGDNTVLYWIERGAQLSTDTVSGEAMTNLSTGSATNATLIVVTGGIIAGGSIGISSADLSGFELDVSSAGSTGVRVEGGARVTIDENTKINLSGSNVVLAKVDGNYYDLEGVLGYNSRDYDTYSTIISQAILTDSGDDSTMNTTNSIGYLVVNGGVLQQDGEITFTQSGNHNIGIQIGGGTYQDADGNTQNNTGGTVENTGDIDVNGIAINIIGSDSSVVNNGTVNATGEVANSSAAAYRLSDGAELILTGSGRTDVSGTAHGVLLDEGAQKLTLAGTTISIVDGGRGNGVENRAGVEGIALSADSQGNTTTINVVDGYGIHTGVSLAQQNVGTINVTGSGYGLYFEAINSDGSSAGTTDNVLNTKDSASLVINVASTDGTGIYTNSTQSILSGASVNILNEEGGSALVVEGESALVEQYGILSSQSTKQGVAVVDISGSPVTQFINHNVIKAADADMIAVSNGTAEISQDVYFKNDGGASIVGKVNLLTGDNTTVELVSTSTGTDFYTAGGDDLYLLTDVLATNTSIFTSLNGGNGRDTLKLDNSSYILTSRDALTGMESIQLTNHSTLTLNGLGNNSGTSLYLGDEADDAVDTGYVISSDSILQILADENRAFASHLSGTGRVEIDTSSSNYQFNFTDNNANDNFAGTVALTHTSFELAEQNTSALTSATLEVGEGSIVTLGNEQDGADPQLIGGLVFNGGTIQFQPATPGETVADGYIVINDDGVLDVSGTGTVQVDIDNVDNTLPLAEQTKRPLLQQDDGNTLIKLVDAANATVTGSGANLTLQDSEGNQISDAITVNITQKESNGLEQTVAIGTYDYTLDTGDNDGLYVAYNLTQVELIGQGEQALILDAQGETGLAADLDAKVTGTGDLSITSQSGEDSVSLSNANNDYTGITTIAEYATLVMGNNSVLGQTDSHTSELYLEQNATFAMAGYRQSIGSLTTEQSSLVNIGSGELSVLADSVVSGVISAESGHYSTDTLSVTSSGQVNIDDVSQLMVVGQLNNLGEVNITDASEASLGSLINQNSILVDSSELTVNGQTENNQDMTLQNSSNALLAGDLSNNGTLSILAQSALQVAGALNNTQIIDIENGSQVTLAGGGVSSGVIELQGESTLNLTGGSLLISGDNALIGRNSNLNINNEATLTVQGSNSGLAVTTQIDAAATVRLNNVSGLGSGDIIIDGLLSVGYSDETVAAGVLRNDLTINEGGIALFSHNAETTVSGDMNGAGSISLTEQSQVILAGDNTDFNGVYTIDQSSVLSTRYDSDDLSSDAVFGTDAQLDNQGEVVLDVVSNWQLTNLIYGVGQVTKNGSGILSLDADLATYTGHTTINEGGILLTNSETRLASSSVTIAKNAYLAGYGGVDGEVNNAGSLYVGQIGGDSETSIFTIGNNLINSGSIYIGQTQLSQQSERYAGNTLVVEGDYTGAAGSYLYFNTVLGGDDSQTDKLIIEGNSYGTSMVKVTNANGLGAKTDAGILLIDINGSISNAEFVQDGRIIAGAYDYVLTRGDANGNDMNSWYLTQPYLRAEAGSYIANVMAIGRIYDLRLHDRLGETQYTDLLTGETSVTSMWLRYQYGGSDFGVGQGALDNNSSWKLVQLGGDIAQWRDETRSDRFHLGVMGAKMRTTSDSTSLKYGYQSKGVVEGYSLGLYGTWYANEADKSGLYIDSWLQWGTFDAEVSGEQLAADSYDITGTAASIESGYAFHISDSQNYTFWLQPKAQATWMRVKADNIVTDTGSSIKSKTDNLMTRVGIKAYMINNQSAIANNNQAGQIFVEANWLHNSTPYSVNIDGDSAQVDGIKNIGEIKLGMEGEIRKNTNVWFNLAYQRGADDYSNTGLMLGLKYSF